MSSDTGLKQTCAMFSTSKLCDIDPDYEAEHPDHPPPGKELCNVLIRRLATEGMEFPFDEVPPDYWEHSNWFMFAKWKDVDYDLIVQTNCAFDPPLLMYVGVFRRVGFLRSLFGGSRRAFDVDHELLARIEMIIREECEASDIQWTDAESAATKVWEE